MTPEQFLKRLRGFWWKGFQTRRFRGMYRFVERDRFDAAVERFEATHGDDLEAACRTLFYDLLWFRTEGGGGNDRGLVEQSTDNIAAAPTLARLFPEAQVHPRRSRRPRRLGLAGEPDPRHRAARAPGSTGIAWWEERLRAIEAGADAIPEGKLLTVGLDELVRMQRARAALRPLFRYLGTTMTKRTRRYFSNRMTTEEANKERWREGISDRKAARMEQLYVEALERLEADEHALRAAACATLTSAAMRPRTR